MPRDEIALDDVIAMTPRPFIGLSRSSSHDDGVRRKPFAAPDWAAYSPSSPGHEGLATEED